MSGSEVRHEPDRSRAQWRPRYRWQLRDLGRGLSRPPTSLQWVRPSPAARRRRRRLPRASGREILAAVQSGVFRPPPGLERSWLTCVALSGAPGGRWESEVKAATAPKNRSGGSATHTSIDVFLTIRFLLRPIVQDGYSSKHVIDSTCRLGSVRRAEESQPALLAICDKGSEPCPTVSLAERGRGEQELNGEESGHDSEQELFGEESDHGSSGEGDETDSQERLSGTSRDEQEPASRLSEVPGHLRRMVTLLQVRQRRERSAVSEDDLVCEYLESMENTLGTVAGLEEKEKEARMAVKDCFRRGLICYRVYGVEGGRLVQRLEADVT